MKEVFFLNKNILRFVLIFLIFCLFISMFSTYSFASVDVPAFPDAFNNATYKVIFYDTTKQTYFALYSSYPYEISYNGILDDGSTFIRLRLTSMNCYAWDVGSSSSEWIKYTTIGVDYNGNPLGLKTPKQVIIYTSHDLINPTDNSVVITANTLDSFYSHVSNSFGSSGEGEEGETQTEFMVSLNNSELLSSLTVEHSCYGKNFPTFPEEWLNAKYKVILHDTENCGYKLYYFDGLSDNVVVQAHKDSNMNVCCTLMFHEVTTKDNNIEYAYYYTWNPSGDYSWSDKKLHYGRNYIAGHIKGYCNKSTDYIYEIIYSSFDIMEVDDNNVDPTKVYYNPTGNVFFSAHRLATFQNMELKLLPNLWMRVVTLIALTLVAVVSFLGLRKGLTLLSQVLKKA